MQRYACNVYLVFYIQTVAFGDNLYAISEATASELSWSLSTENENSSLSSSYYFVVENGLGGVKSAYRQSSDAVMTMSQETSYSGMATVLIVVIASVVVMTIVSYLTFRQAFDEVCCL